MRSMSAAGASVRANSKTASYHAKKIRIHREMYQDQKKYDAMI
jgi:hypothetical protein